jgi:hypothetical protein
VSDGWAIDISLYENAIKCERPLLCLRELEQRLKADLEDEKLECFFRIGYDGVFYLMTAQTVKMVEFSAERMTDLSDLRIDT